MNVFCTREIRQEGIEMMKKAGHRIACWNQERLPSTEELIEICQNQDALVVADANRIQADFLRACPHLKIIALHSVGYNHVDMITARQLAIPIGNTPNAGSKEVADTAFFLMIAVSKNAFYMYRQIFANKWKHFEPAQHLGINLRGKTLGIFGLGSIGFEMARLSKTAFDMPIIYHNRTRNQEAETGLNARLVSFGELLATSDVLSIHSALTPETRNKFDAPTIAKMKPGAILINTARGGIHDEQALIQALQSGKLYGLGLDVTHPEPMRADNPLLKMRNVAITPHIGNAIDTARRRMAIMVAENVIAAGEGKVIPYEVK